MKKIIALLLVCTLVFSCSIIKAAEKPSLDFLKTTASNCDVEQNGTLSFKLNKPLEILELVKNSGTTSNHIDLSLLVESLFDSTMTVQAKTKITEDGKMMMAESHIKSDVPFKANNNLEGDVRANYSVWAEMNLTDEAKPYFDVITTHPFAAKYITCDSNLMLDNGAIGEEELAKLCQLGYNKEFLNGFTDKMIESIEKNAYITGNNKNVRIVFNDIGLKLFIADIVIYAISEVDEALLEEFDDDALTEVLKNVPVFGEEALVMEYVLDSKGRIAEEKTTLNVDMNLYDLIVAFEGEEQLEYSPLSKENSDIDFTVISENSYKYDAVNIEKPVLTEENSIDVFEYNDPYYYETVEDEYYVEEEYYNPWSWAKIDGNCFENGAVKSVRLRSFLENSGYSVEYENGAIRAKNSSEHAKYKEIYFVVGAYDVYTDLHDVRLSKPLFMKDGVTYISINDCEKLTQFMKSNVRYDFETYEGNVTFADFEYLAE